MLRNIDAVDCAATNLSCTNLIVKGETVSDVLTNIGSSTVGNTVFTGTVTADAFTTTGAMTSGSLLTGNITSTGSLNLVNLSTTGSVVSGTEVSAPVLTGTLSTATQNNVTKIGTQTSLSNAGALTQTGAATFATNITQSAGTATLKAVIADSVGYASSATVGGNMTTGGATFTTTTFGSYDTYQIVWLNIGCSGNFTPYLQFRKSGTAYSSGYRVDTSDGLDGVSSVGTTYIALLASSTGLNNGELTSGRIIVKKIRSVTVSTTTTTTWYIQGSQSSSNSVGGNIWGTFIETGGGIDSLVFGVTGGTLSASSPYYSVTPLLF